MSAEAGVQGTVAEGFEVVREEFAAVLDEGITTSGAQLAVCVGGRLVVDLWAGQDMEGDSLTAVYSVTKGAAHLIVALLVQEGALELDREVAYYWPEFAAEGKSALTLRQLLTHQSGVIGADGGFSKAELADDRLIAERLAGQRPFWEPGTAYGYHALVIAALTGEVVRRVTGQSIQELFEERIRVPYGLDFYLGLPEPLEARWLDVQPMEPTREQLADLVANAPARDSLMGIAFNAHAKPPTDLVRFANRRDARVLGQASGGGVGNARGVAGMYAAAISETGGRAPLLKPDTIAEFGRLHTAGTDVVTGDVDHFGLGFEAMGVRYPFLAPDAFGHSGAAGGMGFADPASQVAYGYVRRRFAYPPGGGAAENDRLAQAVVGAAAAA